ncbi:hypothetical protein SAMN02743940_1343 [Nitrosomonas cryotolerans ATCC 49181]|uniref:Uncharacterized protein n=1 Tax=Nitrosomonas cryotolerans ATCC 49181 TaxID=1131553 RepID=A0A1N6HST1_9PROT|nr:hypothetical protein SAMN02743940_1343 [Nitrosomonas cryotolerans ATCC 49181]
MARQGKARQGKARQGKASKNRFTCKRDQSTVDNYTLSYNRIAYADDRRLRPFKADQGRFFKRPSGSFQNMKTSYLR